MERLAELARQPLSLATAASSACASELVCRAVGLAQLGDRQALAFLFVRYADDVCGYVRSIVHDRHRAEGITQQVFMKLIDDIGKYDDRDGVPFSAWLLRVARNAALDHLRRQKLVPGEGVRASDPSFEDALATLPPAQRDMSAAPLFDVGDPGVGTYGSGS